MYLEIVSPEATLFSGEVTSVTVPGVNGEFQMLTNHAPIVSLLQEGTVKIAGHIEIDEEFQDKFSKAPDGKTALKIRSGTVELKDNKVIVLADLERPLPDIKPRQQRGFFVLKMKPSGQWTSSGPIPVPDQPHSVEMISLSGHMEMGDVVLLQYGGVPQKITVKDPGAQEGRLPSEPLSTGGPGGFRFQ